MAVLPVGETGPRPSGWLAAFGVFGAIVPSLNNRKKAFCVSNRRLFVVAWDFRGRAKGIDGVYPIEEVEIEEWTPPNGVVGKGMYGTLALGFDDQIAKLRVHRSYRPRADAVADVLRK